MGSKSVTLWCQSWVECAELEAASSARDYFPGTRILMAVVPYRELPLMVEQMMEPKTKSANLKTERPPEKPVLLRAISGTLRTLEDRGRYFRNLIIAVVAVSGVSCLLTIIFLRWMPLFGFILLIPLVGGFLILDSRRVRRWRSEILQMCRAEALDYPLFQKTIAGFQHLPTRTLLSMLATLPRPTVDKANSPGEEEADDFESVGRRYEKKLFATMLLLMIAISAVAAAAFYHSGTLLICGLGLIVLFAILKGR